MDTGPKQRFVGVGLIVLGGLFLMVSNHLLLAWGNVWPLFAILAGLLLLRLYAAKRSGELLFGGLTFLLLGLFLFLFTLGLFPWNRMGALWPVIPLIAGAGFLAVAAASRHNAAALVTGAAVVLFGVLGILREADVIQARVVAPLVRLWPLVLVLAGVVLLRASAKRGDPDMKAVRAVIDEAETGDAAGWPLATDQHVESAIVDKVKTAGTGSGVPVLVSELRRHFPRFSWVGVYRLREGELTLSEGEYEGSPPGHRQIALSEGLCGASARESTTITVPDVSRDDRYLCCSPAVKSEIVIPIVRGGTVIGVLDIDSDELNAFGGDDKTTLERIVEKTAAYL
jgi:L-methionine (R)-S-oxide reductase